MMLRTGRRGRMMLFGNMCSTSGHSRWISGEKSRARVHQMRSRSDVVMVGAGTARLDNPTLTAREKSVGRQPVRGVVGCGDDRSGGGLRGAGVDRWSRFAWALARQGV